MDQATKPEDPGDDWLAEPDEVDQSGYIPNDREFEDGEQQQFEAGQPEMDGESRPAEDQSNDADIR